MSQDRSSGPVRAPVVEKLWGVTAAAHLGDHAEVWVARPRKGWHSSLHHHAHKFNHFHVVSGVVAVTVMEGGPGEARSSSLGPGYGITVPPLVPHRFEAVTDAVLVEVYWPDDSGAPPDPEDIFRYDEGGVLVEEGADV